MRMYVRKKGGYDAFPLMTEVTSIHAPKIMKTSCHLLMPFSFSHAATSEERDAPPE